MTNPSSSSHIESFATNKPPFFTRTDYPYQKTKMTWFLQSTDLDVWDVIKDDPTDSCPVGVSADPCPAGAPWMRE